MRFGISNDEPLTTPIMKSRLIFVLIHMLRWRLAADIFLIALIVVPGAVMGQSAESFIVNGKKINKATFNSEIGKVMAETGVPAMSLAIIDNGQITFSNFYGRKQRDKDDKVDAQTVFEAASLSKSFLAFLAHKLVSEKKLDLDKPMYQYMVLEPIKHDPRHKLITARMVLSHSTGLENWRWYNNPDTLEFLSDPGKKYEYSGEGYHYLASVIELLVGKPYIEYMEALVYKPLELKATFSAFNADRSSPSNYASGHTSFGKVIEKQKNIDTWPASGIHTVAEDYAKVIVAMFDKRHLSAAGIREIVKPNIKLSDDNPYLYFGLGFAVQYKGNDTIIYQSGSNRGYRAEAIYSVTNKRGLIFLTNSERGNILSEKLCQMTVGLDVSPYFGSNYLVKQYPSATCELLRTYVEGDADKMFSRIQALKTKSNGKTDVRTLNELGWLFFHEDPVISRKLLEDNASMYPVSPVAYFLLGHLNMEVKDYGAACKYFVKAQELNFTNEPIEPDLAECRRKLNQNNNE